MNTEFSYKSSQAIATHQLDRAIDLYMIEHDVICAVTLAGAAEEIFGSLIEAAGGMSSLKEYAKGCEDIAKSAGHVQLKEKQFATERNILRNQLKHICEGEDVFITDFGAIDMLARAINNSKKLGLPDTEKIKSFIERYEI